MTLADFFPSAVRRDRDALAARCKQMEGDIERMKVAAKRLHELYHIACENRDEARKAVALAEFERNNASSQCAAAYAERDALAQRVAECEARTAFDTIGRCADSVVCNGMRSKAQHFDTEHAGQPVPVWSTVFMDERGDD